MCVCVFLALGREEVGGGCPSDLVLLSLFFLFFRALLDSFSAGTSGMSQAHSGQHAILLTHRDKKQIMHSFNSSPLPSFLPSFSHPLFPPSSPISFLLLLLFSLPPLLPSPLPSSPPLLISSMLGIHTYCTFSLVIFHFVVLEGEAGEEWMVRMYTALTSHMHIM